jgi:signal transduction histidine kinase/CheY-like chemotaxis protein
MHRAPTTPWPWSSAGEEATPIETPEPALSQEYEAALRGYLVGGGEAALEAGYSIGRRAIAEGIATLVEMHREALLNILSELPTGQVRTHVDLSTRFLEEATAPFEMTVRGFQESNDQLLQANAELRRASQMKSAFLANMSHELRTPLNSIMGFSQLLVGEDFGPLNQRQVRYLGHITASGRDLLGLVNDILDLSKVEAGQMELHVESIEARGLVVTVLETVEPLAAEKQIEITSRVAAGTELTADRAKLRQMLLNLLSNAIKFTPQAGRVSIVARQVKEQVEFAVSDTGIGMAAEDIGRIFDEFVQLEAGTRRQQGGTGLGLALTKRFAELHGGDIRVESSPGRGSTFLLRLPIHQPNAVAAAEARSISAADPSRPLILVVEDDFKAAGLLARLLEAGGFRTDIASSGTDALKKARELTPSAITLDILLPGLDGWEVLTQLKRDQATRDIPIVVVSMVDNPELARALGALDYFVKPVDGRALVSRLREYRITANVRADDVRLLVIDDEPVNLELVEALLKGTGFKVLRALGGQEGIDAARAARPHLILLDLMMPGVSGFDVVEALRADKSTRSIPILVLTAKDLTEDDKKQLKGEVAAIFARDSTAGTDLVGWLQQIVGKPAVA